MAPEEIRFRTRELEFAALAWGPADGPLALCLHGYPDTAWTWRHLGPRLAADGWRVVAPYMRGYAPTDLAPDGVYQVGALVRDAVQAHAVLGGDDRAVLIGHDWGAAAAYGVASHAPDLFSRIVIMSIPPPAALRLLPPRFPADLRLLARQARCSGYMGFQQLPVISEAMLRRLIPHLWRSWSPGYDGHQDVDRVLEALSGERATAALRYYRAMLQPWARSGEYAAEQRAWLRVPPKPLLYLHGRDDGCMLAALAARGAAVLPAGSEFELVDGAGHFLALERPQYVGDRIARYLG